MSGIGLAGPLLWHLDQLVQRLSHANARDTTSQIRSLCGEFGDEARIYLLTRLLQYLDEGRSSAVEPKLKLLQTELDDAVQLLNYGSVLCTALEGPSRRGACRLLSKSASGEPVAGIPVTAHGLAALSQAVQLSPPTQVGVALAVAQSSTPVLSAHGVHFLVQTLATKFVAPADGGSPPKLSSRMLHGALFTLRTHPAASADKTALTACVRQLQATHGPQVQALAALPSMQGPAVLVDHVAAASRSTRAGRALHGAADQAAGGLAAARLAARELEAGGAADALVEDVCASAGERLCVDEGLAVLARDGAVREAEQAAAAVGSAPRRGGRAARRAREAAEKAVREAQQQLQDSAMAAIPPETAAQAEREALEELTGIVLELGPSGAGSVTGLRNALALAGRGPRSLGLLPLHAKEIAALLLAVGNSMPAAWKPEDVAEGDGPAVAGGGAAAGSADGPTAARDGARVLPGWAAEVVCAAAGQAQGRPAPLALVSTGGAGSGGNFAPSSQGWGSWSPSVFSRVLQEDHSPSWAAVASGLDLPMSASAACTPSGSTQLGAGAISSIGPIAHPGAAWFVFRTVKLGQGGAPFPGHQLLGRWRHPQAQIHALSCAVDMPASELSFAKVSAARLMSPIQGSSTGCGVANQAWCAMDTYSTVLRLAHVGGLQPLSLKLLDRAQQQANGLVVLGLAAAKADAGQVDGVRDSHVLRERVFSTVASRQFASVLAVQVPAALEGQAGLAEDKLRAVVQQQRQQHSADASKQGQPPPQPAVAIVQSAAPMRAAAASLTDPPAVAMTVLVRLWSISPALLVNTLARTSRVLTASAASGPGAQSKQQHAESELLLRGNLPGLRVLPLLLRFAARVGKLLCLVVNELANQEEREGAAGADGPSSRLFGRLPRTPELARSLPVQDRALLGALLCIPVPAIAIPVVLGTCSAMEPQRSSTLLNAWIRCCFGPPEENNQLPFGAASAARAALDLIQGITRTHEGGRLAGAPGGVPSQSCVVDTHHLAALIRAMREGFSGSAAGPEEDEDAPASRAVVIPGLVHAIDRAMQVLPGLKAATDAASGSGQSGAASAPGGIASLPDGKQPDQASGSDSGTAPAPADIPAAANAVLSAAFQRRITPVAAVQQLAQIRDSGRVGSREDVGAALLKLIPLWKRVDAMSEQELRLSGALIGAAVQARLLSPRALGAVLRLVCEGLWSKATPGDAGRPFRFGVFALEQFQARLPAWAHLCKLVEKVPALQQHFAGFVGKLREKMGVLAAQQPGYGTPARPSELSHQLQSVESSLALIESGSPADLVLAPGSDDSVDAQAAAATALAVEASIGSAAAMQTGQQAPGQQHAQQPKQVGGANGATDTAHSAAQAGTGEASGTRQQPPRQMLPTPFLRHRGRIQQLGARFTDILRAVAAGEQPPDMAPDGSAASGAGAGDGGAGGSSVARYRFGPTQPVQYFSSADRPPRRRLPNVPVTVRDRLHFQINNLSHSNVKSTAAEMRSNVADDHLPWFGHYLVVKRVSTQPNFHDLHANFLREFGSPVLYKEVLQATLESARELLGSDSISTSTRERSMLKSIGEWLGLMTLARGRPLLRKELDLRELLLQAFESGKLIACVVFVSSVLEGAAKADAPRPFMPPNPWTVGILGVLRELYLVKYLKMNIKFGMDVVCKTLEVEFGAVPAADLLSQRRKPQLEGTADFSTKAAQEPETVPGLSVEEYEARQSLRRRRKAEGHAGAGRPGADVGGLGAAAGGASAIDTSKQPGLALAPGLEQLVRVPAGLALSQAAPKLQLEPVVARALSMAVCRVMKGVVDRSSAIACTTAKQLVAKDFAMDPSSKRMVAACVLTARQLASSMSVVSCQDQVKAQTQENLREFLTKSPEVHAALGVGADELQVLLKQSHGGDGQKPTASSSRVAPVVQAVEVLSKDHVDLASALIEAAAADRASRDCQSMLAEQVRARRVAESEGRQHTDTDEWQSGSRWPAALPPSLRPGPQGLLQPQLAVYRAFDQLQQNPVAPQQGQYAGGAATAVPAGQPGAGGPAGAASASAPPRMAMARQQARNASRHVADALQRQPEAVEMLGRYRAAMKFLNRAVGETVTAWPAGGAPPSLSSLSSSHPVVSAVEEVKFAATPLPTQDASSQANPGIGRARAAAAATFAQECVEALLQTGQAVRSAADAKWSQALREARGGRPQTSWQADQAEAARRAAQRAAAEMGLLPMQALVAALKAASVTTDVNAVASATAGTLVLSPRERGLDAAVTTAVSRAGVIRTRDLDSLCSAAAAEDSQVEGPEAGATPSAAGLGVQFAAAVVWRCAVRGRVAAASGPGQDDGDSDEGVPDERAVDALLQQWPTAQDGLSMQPAVPRPKAEEARSSAPGELVEVEASIHASKSGSDSDGESDVGRAHAAASMGRAVLDCPASTRLLLRGHVSPQQLTRTVAQLEMAARAAMAQPVPSNETEPKGPAWGRRLACLVFAARAASASDATGADTAAGPLARVPAWVLRMARRADTLPDPEAGLVLAAAARPDAEVMASSGAGADGSGARSRYESGDPEEGDEGDAVEHLHVPRDDMGVLARWQWAMQRPSRATRATRRAVLSLLRDVDLAHRMAEAAPGKGGANLVGVLARLNSSGAFETEAAAVQFVSAAVEVAVRADAAAEAAARAGSGIGSDGSRIVPDPSPAAAQAPSQLLFAGMGSGADAVSTLLSLLVRGADGVTNKAAMLSRCLAAAASVLVAHADAWAARQRSMRAEGAAQRDGESGLLGTQRAAASAGAARRAQAVEARASAASSSSSKEDADALVETEEGADMLGAALGAAAGQGGFGLSSPDADWWVEDLEPEDEGGSGAGRGPASGSGSGRASQAGHDDDDASSMVSASSTASAVGGTGSSSRRAARRVWRLPMARLPFDPRPYTRVLSALIRVCLPPEEAPQSVDHATLDALSGGGAEVAAAAAAAGSKSAAGPRPPAYQSEAVLASARTQLTMLASTAVGNALLCLRPQRVPAFALSWITLLCHRSLLPAVLHSPGARGWPMLLRLLRTTFSFLGDTLRACPGGMPPTLRLFYRGVLRLVVVVLHDAQDFLADNHHELCEVLPPVCLQLRNLVLSATPRQMVAPEPLTSQLKIDTIPEIKLPPVQNADATAALDPSLARDIQGYLQSGGPPSMPARVAAAMQLSSAEVAAVAGAGAGVEEPARYSHARLQALVALVAQTSGTAAAGDATVASRSPAIPLLKQVLQQLQPSGKYLLLDAVASQLRYPNSHTHFFSVAVLKLFAEAPDDAHREILTRVLLQKLICNRPHPWGLLITFIELIKVPQYRFWSRPFTHCAPEIESLFNSVARSCIGQQTSVAELAEAEEAQLGSGR